MDDSYSLALSLSLHCSSIRGLLASRGLSPPLSPSPPLPVSTAPPASAVSPPRLLLSPRAKSSRILSQILIYHPGLLWGGLA